jgi:hypothetical protein
MIIDKRILCVSCHPWEALDEQQVMIEILAGANNIVWVDPYGRINANILPRVYRLKESLTVYCPGINLLPLSFLNRFNQARLLLQIKLYLLERDFEPNLVWIDNMASLNFVKAYKKEGIRSLYYQTVDDREDSARIKKKRLEGVIDFVYRAKSVTQDISEEAYMNLMQGRVEEISKVLSGLSE